MKPISLAFRIKILFLGFWIILSTGSALGLRVLLEKHLKKSAYELAIERLLLIEDLIKGGDYGFNQLESHFKSGWEHDPRVSVHVDIRSSKTNKALGQNIKNINLDKHYHVKKIIKVSRDKEYLVNVYINKERDFLLLETITKSVWALLFVLLILAYLASSSFANHALAPLLEMISEVKSIDQSSLKKRISLTEQPKEVRPLANSFNKLLDKLEESFLQISRFSEDIAHELRTPLAAILIKTEVTFDRERTPKEYQETLESIHRDTEELIRLTDTLLFLAKAERGGMAPDRQKLDINNELVELVDFYEVLASENQIKLDDLGSNNLSVFANKSLLRRAVGNLIQNSIQHTPQGTTIKIGAYETDSHTIIFVEDNGPGIESKHQKRIFDRLYQVEASRSSLAGNKGLGLSIVKSIMKVHSGEVLYTSLKPHGSRFELKIPKQQIENQ